MRVSGSVTAGHWDPERFFQAPVLSYGFYRCANLPELCVSWLWAARGLGPT